MRFRMLPKISSNISSCHSRSHSLRHPCRCRHCCRNCRCGRCCCRPSLHRCRRCLRSHSCCCCCCCCRPPSTVATVASVAIHTAAVAAVAAPVSTIAAVASVAIHAAAVAVVAAPFSTIVAVASVADVTAAARGAGQWWSSSPQRNQYNFSHRNSAFEKVKIAGFAILGQFGTEYEKIPLCAICVWRPWGKRKGLHDQFGAKCAKKFD